MRQRRSSAANNTLDHIVLLHELSQNFNESRTRVIYAWDYVEWGGAQIHFLALIKEARKCFDVIVVLPEGTDDQFLGFLDAEDIGYRLFYGSIDLAPKTSVSSKVARHWRRLKSEYAMLRTIREIGLENAIVHTDILPGQSLFSLAWLAARVPVFLTLHNALPTVQRWRFALWKLKFGCISKFGNVHVFCTNKHAAEYFRELFRGKVAAGIQVTYDSIDPVEIEEALASDFDRDVELTRLGIAADKFVILAVGQFVDRKGRWTFLDAAQLVHEKTRAIHFVWVSPNAPNDDDQRKIDSYGLSNTLRILRSKDIGNDRNHILRFFRVADVFALPSFVEGVPISLLEAMAMGIPCISTNVYGIPEAVINEKTGLLIEAGRADEHAEAILSLWYVDQLRKRLAVAGRQHAITHFDEREAARIAVSEYVTAVEEAR
jgi:glycosyltransferase involved in cell wall biosynthesis